MSALEPNDEAWETLKLALAARAEVDKAGGAPMFMGRPDRWYEKPTFRCEHGHVTSMVLKCEGLGRDACLYGARVADGVVTCMGRVTMTFPEDETGLLPLLPVPPNPRHRRR